MRIAFTLLLLFSFSRLLAQPSNDSCQGAVSLTVNSGNIPTLRTAGTTVDATESMTGCSGFSDDDVWYKFVATGTTHSVIVFANTLQYGVAEIFSGSCGSLTSVACNPSIFPGQPYYTVGANSLVAGNTYYVRVYSAGNNGQGSFDIAVVGTAPNDDCAGAVAVTATGAGTCAAVNGSSIGATMSLPGCSFGSGSDDDVWFKFVATATTHKIKVFDWFRSPQLIEGFSGTCGSLTSLGCDQYVSNDTAERILTGLTIGNTYYFRVYSLPFGDPGLFKVCVTQPQPPANDECSGAVVLTPQAVNSCTGGTTGSTKDASASAVPVTYGYPDDDVWYVFNATATRHTIQLTKTGGNDYPAMEIFKGNCAALSTQRAVFGYTRTTFSIGDLTIGQPVYVRVFSNYESKVLDFNICVFDSSGFPANDQCANATALAPGNGSYNCAEGTTVGASQSRNNFCSNISGQDQLQDVWYSFVAGATSVRTKVERLNANAQFVFEVYSGTCGSLTSLYCSNLVGGFGDVEQRILTGLSIGNTYYIRITSKGDATAGPFRLCLNNEVPPANDDCSGAITLVAQPNAMNGKYTQASNLGATSSGAIFTCYGSNGYDDDVWFKFVATKANMAVITEGVFDDQQYGLQGPMVNLYSGSCGALSSMACGGTFLGGGGNHKRNVLVANGLSVGQTYYLRVFSEGTDLSKAGRFLIIVSEDAQAPANDVCSGAITLTPSADGSCNATAGNTLWSGNENIFCNGNNDVWFKFVATATTHRIRVTGLQKSSGIGLFTGSNCSSLTQVNGSCAIGPTANGTTYVASSLTIGDTYYIKVYPGGNEFNFVGPFSICVSTPGAAAPVNDECAGAITLPVCNDGTCAPSVLYSTYNATRSMANCGFSGEADDDVWFKFVATDTKATIEVQALSDMCGIELFDGDCSGLTSLSCNQNNVLNASGLTIGNTYYLRLYSLFFGRALEYRIKIFKTIAAAQSAFSNTNCVGTNLVPDPSFETFSCPQDVVGTAFPGNYLGGTYWRIPTKGTPDLFAACNDGFSGGGRNVNVPNNQCFGNQSPKNGKAYAGLFSYYFGNSYREYIEAELSSPMTVGMPYLVSMHVNLSDFSTVGANGLGMALSTGPTRISTFQNINLIPQVVSNAAITDKNGWTQISAIITPTQPFTHLVIGNFRNDAATDTLHVIDSSGFVAGGTSRECTMATQAAYYYIDDVVVAALNGQPPANDLCTGSVALTDAAGSGTGVQNADLSCATPDLPVCGTSGRKTIFYDFYTDAGSTFVTAQISAFNNNTGQPIQAAIFSYDCAGTPVQIGSCMTISGNGPVQFNGLATETHYFLVLSQALGAGNSTLGVELIQGSLPVHLLHFKGNRTGDQSLLQWSTANEQHSSHFELQHGTDGTTFRPIARVAAAGNSNTVREYAYTHTDPVKGSNYYRLLMVDLDDRKEYAPTVRIEFPIKQGIGLYPVPAKDHFVLRMQGTTAATMNIYDGKGQLVLQRNKVTDNAMIPIGHLVSGVYTVVISNGSAMRTLKLVKE